MKTINLQINDSIYEHILFFLQNLPKDMITISKDIDTKDKITKLFEENNIDAFKDIKDPISWQKSMRDEWE